MNVTSLIGISYGMTFLAYIPFTLIFLVTQWYGVKLYVLTDPEDCKRIQKRVSSWATHTTDNDKGYGYSIGYWYFVNIQITDNDYGDKYSVWMIATEASYRSLLNGKTDGENKGTSLLIPNAFDKTDIIIHERVGSLTNPWFKHRTIKINTMEPRPAQAVIIEKIKEWHAVNGHTVVYLHGPPGTGKSVIGILLANVYKCAYCNTLKPWQPGDNFGSLYADADPTPQSPLVVVFDEFDGPLQQIHAGISPHPKVLIQIANKTGWNQLLDEIHIGIYPNVILVLTSNKSPEFINSLDPSYIREGRVDLTFEL
uniref:ATPase AAA-type core domain-containing protein n=1 Tax=viral metagenome TaxID=1070528 RepID=A0A6C0JXK1_9ZZZZ